MNNGSTEKSNNISSSSNEKHWVKTEEETLNDNILEKPHIKDEVEGKDYIKDDLIQVGAHRLDFNKPLVEDLKSEAFAFTIDCHVCGGSAETKMCVVTIPYFKELVIMTSICGFCGAKSADTKNGGYFNVIIL